MAAATAMLAIAAVGTLVGAGVEVYNAVEAGNARREANKLAREQAAEQNKLLQEAKDEVKKREETEAKTAANAAAMARNRDYQRATSTGALGLGKSSTLLGAPTGATTQPKSGGKTLLGT